MKPYRYNLLMPAGSAGYRNVTIPAGYKFASVINNTPNEIMAFQDNRTSGEQQDSFLTVPPYTQQTIPIDERRDFTFIYTDGGGLDAKKAEVIFSLDNLGIQGVLGTLISGTVTLGVDSIGLAKQSQLPASLSGSGNLKAVISEALPAGTNNIGDVDVLTLPQIDPKGWTWKRVNGSGDVVVKASAGRVARLVADASETVTIKDGSTQAWKEGSFESFGLPLACNTNITVNISPSGTAWILYQ